MAGIKTLRKIQLGREASTDHDAGVAATTIFRGEGTIEDQSEYVFPEESVGLMVPSDRVYIPKKLGAITFEEVEATYEQIVHILEAGIKAIGTGTSDGSGSGQIYNYTFPTTTPNTPTFYTIEGGDNQAEEEMYYCFVEDFALKGEAGGAVMMSANWKGRHIVDTDSFTGALSVPTVEEILFSKGKLYIDVDTDSFGTTQKTQTLLDFEINVKSGFLPVWTADGQVYYAFVKQVQPEVELKVTFEHDGTATAEKTAWRNRTMRGIQLKFEGSALTTPGTSYTYKTLIINLAGKWSKFEKIGERDGNDVVTGTLRGVYSASRASMGAIIVVNELATVP